MDSRFSNKNNIGGFTMSEIIKKVHSILGDLCEKNEDGTYYYKLYVDCRNEISGQTVAELMVSDNPVDAFYEKLGEWAIDAEFYEQPELISSIKERLNDDELAEFCEHKNEITKIIDDSVMFYYDAEDYNRAVRVNIMLDTGDANYDFTCCNILNWYSGGDRSIDKESPILWLAKTQKEATFLRREIKQYGKKDCYPDNRFIKSVVEELENLCTSMGSLTFLAEINLLDLLDLQALINENKNGYILLDKSVECGLFDSWNGGGSLLGIELNNDIKVPFDVIHRLQIDEGRSGAGNYTVSDVYALTYNCWRNVAKGIVCKDV